jgi:hypothetical protein
VSLAGNKRQKISAASQLERPPTNLGSFLLLTRQLLVVQKN